MEKTFRLSCMSNFVAIIKTIELSQPEIQTIIKEEKNHDKPEVKLREQFVHLIKSFGSDSLLLQIRGVFR